MAGSFTIEELARQALERQKRGQEPTQKQAAALEKVRKKQRDEIGREWVRAIPKTFFSELSGRQIKQLHEQAVRYGMPVSGKTIDLQTLLHWLFDFLAQHGRRLLADEVAAGADRAGIERVRAAQAERLERENLAALGKLLPSEQVRRCHGVMAGLLRQYGEAVERQYGRQAQQHFVQMLEACQGEVDKLLGTNGDNHDKETNHPATTGGTTDIC